MNKSKRAILTVLPFLASVPLAQAGGPALTGLFAEAGNSETVFNNPAGMTRLEGTQFTGQAITIVGFSQFEVDEELTTVDGGDPRGSNPALAPGAYYSRQMNDKWWLGASLNVPSGFGANFGPDWAGRYHADEFTLVFAALTPTVAYKVNDKLSLGAGLNIIYTSSKTSVQVNNKPFLDGAPDGKAKIEADGVGVGWSVAGLYEFSENTRIGVAFRSESEADLDTTIDFENVIRPSDVLERLQGQTIEVSDRVPMSVGAGIYHHMDNDWAFTWDLLWVEFSRFGVTEIKFSEEDIDVSDGSYEDFYATTIGLSFPLRPNMRGSIGALYVEQPVKDENRSFGIAVDEMWGIGAGVNYQLDNGNDMDINLNLIDTGKAPIDTGDHPVSGRVAGEFEDHYSIMLDFTYHWR